MDNAKILKALEDTAAIVGTFTGSLTTISLAMVAIKGIFSVVLGKSLEGPEYADAIQRGLDRNKGSIQGRIDDLKA
jgi:hypothetical protein